MTLNADTLWPALEPWCGAGHWWLGLSGGLDSCLLLSLLAELRDAPDRQLPGLTAIHVDHQLHPDSGRWAQHCAALCKALSVPLETRRVDVEPGGEGLEAAARRARYEVFESLVQADGLLLLAHHLDDQVETFFLRLMRGAGARGLSGMPASRPLRSGHVLRPLLPHSRVELAVCAAQRGLQWVEDPSNADIDLDRNFLRQRLLPVLAERWPGYRDAVAASMASLADAELTLAAVDEARLAPARGKAFGAPLLALDRLPLDSEWALGRLLRRWLEQEGAALPSRARLLEFCRQLQSAAEDSLPALQLGDRVLRRYRKQLYLVPAPSDLPAEQALSPGEVLVHPGWGRLALAPAESGLALPAGGAWQLRWRSGGERCRPLGRDHGQALKQLLQERGVPPWARERLPLLYDGEELAAVADLWVCEGHQARSPAPAYQVVWEPSPGPV